MLPPLGRVLFRSWPMSVFLQTGSLELQAEHIIVFFLAAQAVLYVLFCMYHKAQIAFLLTSLFNTLSPQDCSIGWLTLGRVLVVPIFFFSDWSRQLCCCLWDLCWVLSKQNVKNPESIPLLFVLKNSKRCQKSYLCWLTSKSLSIWYLKNINCFNYFYLRSNNNISKIIIIAIIIVLKAHSKLIWPIFGIDIFHFVHGRLLV